MLELKIGNADDAMDVLSFISSVVGSVAWPLSAFSIAFLFRLQIRSLIGRIKKLSLGDNSVDFGQKLDEAEAEVEAGSLVTAVPEVAGLNAPDERTAQLISISPAAAVLDGWKNVERKTLKLAKPFMDSNCNPSRVIPFRLEVKNLFDAKQITAVTFTILNDLQNLRNTAMHTDYVSVLDAIRFANLTQKALLMLDVPDVRPDPPTD